MEQSTRVDENIMARTMTCEYLIVKHFETIDKIVGIRCQEYFGAQKRIGNVPLIIAAP